MTDSNAANQQTIMSWRNAIYLVFVVALGVMCIEYHKRLLSTLVFPLSPQGAFEFYALIYLAAACFIAFFLNKSGGDFLAFAFLPFIGNYYFAILMELSTLNVVTSDGTYFLKFQDYTFLVFAAIMNALILIKLNTRSRIIAYNFAAILSISLILLQYLKMQNVF